VIEKGVPLKNMLNFQSLREFAETIKTVHATFEVEEFLKSTIDETWEDLELKARGRQVTLNLGKYLPSDYKEAISIIDRAIVKCRGFALMCFNDFVEVYGQDEENLDLSIGALGRYTEYMSSEFAVRPFIIKYEGKMMRQMYAWSKDDNEHRRRLASEGCRPALPWGQALPKYKKDPTPILPILEELKADSSLSVRKSVANNLNDISKTHPDLVIKIAKDWYGKNDKTDWIVKHACRTLLKKGHPDALAIFSYGDITSVDVEDFGLNEKLIKIGENITFSFTISTKKATKVRLEYGIDYVKSNGKRNRKMFQLSEISLKANGSKKYTRKHSFANVSTRKHYPGTHSVTLVVNGVERGTLDFEVE
jgi:3-methyladenine DNA glycosylase AlkC